MIACDEDCNVWFGELELRVGGMWWGSFLSIVVDFV